MDFNWQYIWELFPILAKGVGVTIQISAIAAFFSLLNGLIIALISYYRIKILYPIARVYVFIIRGTPVVAQLYFFYFGLAIYSVFVRQMPPLVATAIVMSLNTSAFMSESMRAALMSVDNGQKEAAYSLGMTNFQLTHRIVIPQAVRIALPPLFNDIINLVKMSSLAFMLGVPDIMGVAKTEGARTYRYFEIYAVAMVIYLIIIAALNLIQKAIENKSKKAY